MICPLCASKNVKYFASKNTYICNKCNTCKTVFIDSLPSSNKLRNYYEDDFLYENGKINEKIIRKRAHIILKTIRKLAPGAKTLCDVGSGYGYFLDEANKGEFVSIGIEPCKKLAKYAENTFHISQFVGDLKDYMKSGINIYDVVTCIHVIEHIPNPRLFLLQLAKLVKPGGLLYIETPNSDSHLLSVEKEHYTFLLPPDHLWLLSIQSFKRLMPSNFEIFSINTYSYPEHLMSILKHLFKRKDTINPNCVKKIGSSKVRCARKLSKWQHLSYLLFDQLMAPLFTGMLNLHHKGSILELYIKKKRSKSGL